MTRQRYQRLRSLNTLNKVSRDNSLSEQQSRHLARHLNRIIIILIILIVVVYLVLIFVNF